MPLLLPFGKRADENPGDRRRRVYWLELYSLHSGVGGKYTIVNYDKLTYAGNLANLKRVSDHPNYRFVKGDICDAPLLESAMRGCDAVVHFAAESHVDRSIYEPSPVIRTNINGTFALLGVARKLSISRFAHISTDEVYGDIPPH
jgi:dTDP-glucose 4,6-dehydratase